MCPILTEKSIKDNNLQICAGVFCVPLALDWHISIVISLHLCLHMCCNNLYPALKSARAKKKARKRQRE